MYQVGINKGRNHSTCFGRSFRPSSGVRDSTHTIRYMSYRFVDCMLTGTRWNRFHLVSTSKFSTNLYDIYLMLCVQYWTPDDGRKDRPKHVEWYSINSKNWASSWFYYRNISRCTVPWTSRICVLPAELMYVFMMLQWMSVNLNKINGMVFVMTELCDNCDVIK